MRRQLRDVERLVRAEQLDRAVQTGPRAVPQLEVLTVSDMEES